MSDDFRAVPANAPGPVPLSVGLVGPPSGGKTVSMLRLMMGIKEVRSGPAIVLDTEGGRSRKHAKKYPFEVVIMEPPFRSARFLEAIKQQLPRNPSSIGIDTLSDEHEGEGGYLDFHDEQVPLVGGNEWAAWSKPAMGRRKLIGAFLHTQVPLIMTFRARMKTDQRKKEGSNRKEVISLGWSPVAPLEIIHALDLCCILPSGANGVAEWTSEMPEEKVVIKSPWYLAEFLPAGVQFNEKMGADLARWAQGDDGGRAAILAQITAYLSTLHPGKTEVDKQAKLATLIDLGMPASWKEVSNLPIEALEAAVGKMTEGA